MIQSFVKKCKENFFYFNSGYICLRPVGLALVHSFVLPLIVALELMKGVIDFVLVEAILVDG